MTDRDHSGNMKTRAALLIYHDSDSGNGQRIARMLDFFGIPWKSITMPNTAESDSNSFLADQDSHSILVSAHCLAELWSTKDPEEPSRLLASADSVYVYGFMQTDACRSLLRRITGDLDADIVTGAECSITVSPTDDEEICGPLSGLEIALRPEAIETMIKVCPETGDFRSIISAPDGCILGAVTFAGVRYFIDSSQTVIDLGQCSASYFDIKKTFAGAVPIAMYLKWAFRDVCWQAPSTNACLIIDDPLLKPRHGFLSYRELEGILEQHQAAATIGFIPWNWRRTNRRTVASFLERRGTFSICMHGCDHCGEEMACRSAISLDRELKTARARMKRLFERTGLGHDNIEIFPQGAFSVEALAALKENGFVAAVNTEVSPLDPECNRTTIADLWSVAVRCYGGFPIFTRRYMEHGIENFAFDGLLGKPCFVVGHHDIFRGHGRNLRDFLERLTSLRWELNWRTLEEAVRHSYSMQRRNGIKTVTMFATKLCLENAGQIPEQFVIVKEEPFSDDLQGIIVNGNPVPYACEFGRIHFALTLPPQAAMEIRCVYRQRVYPSPISDSLSYAIGVAFRRYLSEVRDKWASKNALLYQLTTALVRLWKRWDSALGI